MESYTNQLHFKPNARISKGSCTASNGHHHFNNTFHAHPSLMPSIPPSPLATSIKKMAENVVAMIVAEQRQFPCGLLSGAARTRERRGGVRIGAGVPQEIAARIDRVKMTPGLTLVGNFNAEAAQYAHFAYNLARQIRANRFGPDFFDGHQIELRIPPEEDEFDGPSGATATAVAIYSLAIQRCVRMDTILSASLVIANGVATGALERIGGVVEKVLGAADFGRRRMILAPENAVDIAEAGLTAEEHPGMEIIFCANLSEILEIIF
uniref:Lon proteolytic domain-containing protein n=1 Tax=Globodera rostochiensis TaxID=31243 RepID=A0A914HFV9_GLORO